VRIGQRHALGGGGVDRSAAAVAVVLLGLGGL
jgi:hypothetical protein